MYNFRKSFCKLLIQYVDWYSRHIYIGHYTYGTKSKSLKKRCTKRIPKLLFFHVIAGNIDSQLPDAKVKIKGKSRKITVELGVATLESCVQFTDNFARTKR